MSKNDDAKIKLTTTTPKPPPTIAPILINPSTYECKIFDDYQKFTKPTDMIVSTNKSEEFSNLPFRMISKYDSTGMEDNSGSFEIDVRIVASYWLGHSTNRRRPL